jgi:hypothetical protein
MFYSTKASYTVRTLVPLLSNLQPVLNGVRFFISFYFQFLAQVNISLHFRSSVAIQHTEYCLPAP